MIHHWDFYGVDSAKTAEHFKAHLDQFLAARSIESKQSGFFNADEGHTCVWLAVETGEHSATISQRLKPQRSLTNEEHAQLIGRISSAETITSDGCDDSP
jgi:hypothetical protein